MMCGDDINQSINTDMQEDTGPEHCATSNSMNESVKVLENLQIKIGEAKHLIPGNRDTRNSYCSVCLDQEEIFKTRIIEKSLSPFFQEDVDFDIPHKFRLLCFNLHDVQEDVLVKRDHIYAKVAIKKTDIVKYNAHEHWFPLMPVESCSKVQGQVYIDVKFSHYQSLGLNVEDGHKLTVRIPECSGLMISSGNCDPYVTVSLQGTHRNETKKTRVRKATTNPHFDDEFVFELNKNNNLRRSWFDLTLGGNEMKVADQEHWTALTLKVAVYSSGTLGDEFLGEVKIPLSSLIDMKCHAGWYLLNARSGKTTGNGVKEDFGSIRVKIVYIKDYVFPSHVYNELLQQLVSSVNVEPVSASWPNIMSTVCGVRNRPQVVRSLVRIFLHQSMLSQLIEPLADDEIDRNQSPSTLFRNSSLVSGLIEESMRLVGLNYLFNILSPSIEKIKTEKKPCEIDPSRLGAPSFAMASSTSSIDMNSQASDQSQSNMNNLWEYVHQVVTAILKSAPQCPSLFCEIFNGLRNSVTKHMPDDANTRYSAVASFIFLRFFAAALLSPRQYKLVNEDMDATSSRTCTLVAKIVQHLCNKSMPKAASTQTASYVNTFCKRFVTQEHLDSIQNFIDVISSTMKCLDSKGRTSSILEKVMLKEGEMVKRAQGRTFLLSRKNFKTRYFALTNYELSYRKNKSSKPLCIIPVQEIIGVEKLQEESFRMGYMFQVIQPNRVLYCKANNSVDQKEWMDVLLKVCTCNRNRAQHYHPGAFLQGKYICCNSTTQKAPGCTRVTGLPASIRLSTDLDRELERIYSLLSSSVERIHQLQEECGARAVYVGPQLPSSSQFDSEESVSVEDTDIEQSLPPPNPNKFDVEDPQHTFRTLCSMLECISTLKELHEEYFTASGANDAELGTHERPYGDT
uniref:Ras GTPase-activating protein 3-like n=1 Tax=Phallusia mammillata TaxID=59560 RepID=A0A6F9DR49_9ASCI|nr:ras GTPase-activating protein 3-like [Phallusia mammillata]